MAIGSLSQNTTTIEQPAAEQGLGPRRPQALDAGLFLLVVAVPLTVTPFSFSPFADAKLALLAAGTLLIWLGGLRLDRRLGIAAAAWFAISIVAAVAGVDPIRSLVGLDKPLTGLLMLGPCAYLAVAGASLPVDRVRRLQGWLVWTALVMAIVVVGFRMAGGAFEAMAPNLSFYGSTAGNPVFAGAFLSVAIVAVSRRSEWSLPRAALTVAVLGLGLAAGGERVAYVLPIVGLGVALAWGRSGLRRTLVCGGVLVVVFTGWGLLVPAPQGTVDAAAQFSGGVADAQRFRTFEVSARAALERPVLGWGPANGWSAIRATAEVPDTELAGAGWDEAHNLVLQTAMTTGLLGLAALVAMGVVLAARLLHAPRDDAWLVGAVAALGAFSSFEPFNLTATPLLFLLVGVAAGSATRRRFRTQAPATPPTHAARAMRAAVGAGLVACTVLAVASLVAATYQADGERYESEDALRTSLALAPWRTTTLQSLSEDLALDSRSGDERALEESRALVLRSVADHPWDPNVRIDGVEVNILRKDLEEARRLMGEHLERFPGDRAFLVPIDELDLQVPPASVPNPAL